MRLSPFRSTMVLILSLVSLPAFATRAHRTTASGHSHATLKHVAVRRHGKTRKAPVVRGQRQIDPARATQIQSALIQQNYLTGAPSGQWDAETESAMQKFQADHGWQTKLTPDSRALIKLGLGPSPSDAAPAAPSVQAAVAPNTSDSNTLASAHAARE